jgi:hypothetical protein
LRREVFLGRRLYDVSGLVRIAVCAGLFFSVPSGLNLIYKDSGGAIEVLDLVANETLRKYGAKNKASRKKTLKSAGKVNGSV